jgi:tRNA (adenine37-N6)-methyltransferase
MQAITIQPIATIKNDIRTSTTDADWGKVISEIHFDEQLAPGLQGLSDWSHVIVIFSMHETRFKADTDLVQRPRGLADMPEIGIFAQRTQQRPNTIGVSAVKIVDVQANVVRVKGLDAINGTPVLDIKPYAPIYDSASEPLVPGWFIRLMQGYF